MPRSANLYTGAALLAALVAFAYISSRRRKRFSGGAPHVSAEEAPSGVTAPAAPAPAPTPAPPADPVKDAEVVVDKSSEYQTGHNVRLKALKSKPELNGQRGSITGYDEAKGRYNVHLVESGKTLQIKPDNLTDAGEISPSELSAVELFRLTLSTENVFTSAHAERVVDQLRSQQTSPVIAGCLLRCVCHIKWEVACVATASGKARPHRFPDGTGSDSCGLVMCSDAEFAKPIQAASPPLTKKMEHCCKLMLGREIFNEQTLDKIEWVSLNPVLGASAETSTFTSLQKAYFPSLMHMSEAMHIEGLLSDVNNYFADDDPVSPPPASVMEAARALMKHVLFCFNASKDKSGQNIVPITAMSSTKDSRGKPANFMLLYTCEMLLENARPHLDAMGAFAQCGGASAVPSGPVPFSDLLASLNQPNATNAGIHLNEFVPGIAPERKALGLTTRALEQLQKMAMTEDAKDVSGTVV